MDRDLLDRRLIDGPLFYRWSADSQKLYYWLRRHVCRGEADAPAEALAWHTQGYLPVYATAEVLMARATPVSKNTLTKLVDDLRALDVVRTPRQARGYLFLLGEWLRRPSPQLGRPLYFETFYLDQHLPPAAAPATDAPPSD
ncbi:MAG: hypothetical protein IT340_06505 [Chloroflexi bacterium]|nr:hypothetical protein [Chloroflexota bacterium]